MTYDELVAFYLDNGVDFRMDNGLIDWGYVDLVASSGGYIWNNEEQLWEHEEV